MDGHDAAIFGEPKISFDGISALPPGFGEGGHGVFGGIGGSSAMGDDQGLAPTRRNSDESGTQEWKEFHQTILGGWRGFIKRKKKRLPGL